MPLRPSRLADLLVLAGGLGMLLLVTVPTLAWLDPLPGDWQPLLPRMPRQDLSAAQRFWAWAMALPPYLAVAAGLGQLLVFCRRYVGQRMFTTAAATALRRFGLWLIFASLLLPLSRLGLSLLVAELGLAGPRGIIAFMFTALGLTFGLVIVLFAAILREAARLAEENAGFV